MRTPHVLDDLNARRLTAANVLPASGPSAYIAVLRNKTHCSGYDMTKRAFDCVTALAGLLCLWPLFVIVAALIKLDSEGSVFFRQVRVGRGFRPFWMYKFRTMVSDAARRGGPITYGDDPRITSIGACLRRTKIDELPQLINVLKGDMSIVGPRPEVPQYVECFREDYKEILKVRPGITDLASLKFRNEAELLGRSSNPDEMYLRCILPEKVSLGKQYVREFSFSADLSLIFKTLTAVFRLKVS
jgi:lipopolysaccharide/colanic/teichoic acid biosynthesis glycosyltransferase